MSVSVVGCEHHISGTGTGMPHTWLGINTTFTTPKPRSTKQANFNTIANHSYQRNHQTRRDIKVTTHSKWQMLKGSMLMLKTQKSIATQNTAVLMLVYCTITHSMMAGMPSICDNQVTTKTGCQRHHSPKNPNTQNGKMTKKCSNKQTNAHAEPAKKKRKK